MLFNSSIYNDDIHQILNRAITELSTKYHIVLHNKDEEDILLEKFYNIIGNQIIAYNSNTELKYYCALGFEAENPFKLLIFEKIETIYRAKSGQASTYQEFVLVAYKNLLQKYGDILIRKESLNDKIIELFLKQEVDLEEFPEFSSKYYVIANQQNDVVNFIDKRRAALFVENNDIEGYYVLKEKDLWLINLKNLNEDEIIRTAEMIAEI